jgi:thiamine transport system substrate-binding protein
MAFFIFNHKESVLMKIMVMGLMSLMLICGIASGQNPATELTVMTHDSFSVSKDVLARFEQENRVKIRFIKAGDAGSALNQAILSKGNPLADVFYGVDNTFMSRALKAEIFLPYQSPNLIHIGPTLKLDTGYRLSPVDYGDVCLNYDKKWFASRNLQPPGSLEDLIRPEYTALTVVESPATSSPGLAFLLTTIGHFGENGFLDYWKKLKQNQVLIVNGWKEAYWGNFTVASKGNRPIVVSYASSPPAEVHFSKSPLIEAPSAAVTAKGTCFRQIEFAGILKGTRHQKMAEKLIDFFLDKPFQEDIPLQMFMFPANSTAQLPDVFVNHAKTAVEPVGLDSDRIESQREKWLESWADAVLR